MANGQLFLYFFTLLYPSAYPKRQVAYPVFSRSISISLRIQSLFLGILVTSLSILHVLLLQAQMSLVCADDLVVLFKADNLLCGVLGVDELTWNEISFLR